MKKALALSLFVLYGFFSFAYSTFLLRKNGQYVFGRNYDWVTGNGAVMINQRGVQKSSFAPEGGKKISWIAKWGSISFNQYGKEFPHGGMNEKGLVVELMWLSETAYPKADDRAALNELQWIQYQLDNCSSVEDVLATDRLLRISRDKAAPLHYLIADATGRAATIEFLNGKMVIHTGKDLNYPVLTNTVYTDAVEKAKQKGEKDNSVERFSTACQMVQEYESTETKEDPVTTAFTILNKIEQPGYTKWKIVYDINNRSVYFVTSDSKNKKQVSFKEFDFSCRTASLFLPLNGAGQGAVRNSFKPLDVATNKALLQQSAKESKGYVEIAPASIDAAAAYMKQIACK